MFLAKLSEILDFCLALINFFLVEGSSNIKSRWKPACGRAPTRSACGTLIRLQQPK